MTFILVRGKQERANTGVLLSFWATFPSRSTRDKKDGYNGDEDKAHRAHTVTFSFNEFRIEKQVLISDLEMLSCWLVVLPVSILLLRSTIRKINYP